MNELNTVFYTNFYPYKDKIRLIHKNENGESVKSELEYSPSVFIETEDIDSPFKNIYNKPLKKIQKKSISDARKFINSSSVNTEIYGFPRFEYSAINEIYEDEFPFNIKHINVASIDIECEIEEGGFPNPELAPEVINAITLSVNKEFWTFGLQHIDNIGDGLEEFIDKDVKLNYIYCKDEYSLLQQFLSLWISLNIDIITGWNITTFDLPYIYNRIKKIISEKSANSLSPWGDVRETNSIGSFGTSQYSVDIKGISNLDYLDVYKKFTYKNRESYKLDFIAHVELGTKKLDYSEFSSLKELYKKDYKKFIQYNIIDVELINKLENKLKLLELICVLAFATKINFVDTFKAVKMWDVVIANFLLKDNILVRANPEDKIKEQYGGGYVKDVIKGYSKYVVSFDFTSLYPKLITQFNIGPDTIRKDISGYLKPDDFIYQTDNFKSLKEIADENDCALALNGAMFSREKESFLSKLMKIYFDKRKFAKKQMIQYKEKLQHCSESEKEKIENKISKYENLQMAFKIAINSAYGALGSIYFRMYDTQLAESITLSGQTSIRVIEKALNNFTQKILSDNKDRVVVIDTDSGYLDITDLVNKFFNDKSEDEIISLIDKISKDKILPVIDDSIEEFHKSINGFELALDMKREVIGSLIISERKKYITKVFDNEGVRLAKPEIKVTGLEAVRSSTPEFCRNKMKQIYGSLFDMTEIDCQKEFQEIKEEFMSLPLPDISMPSTSNNMEKYNTDKGFISGTPFHIKGAIAYNRLIEQKGLQNKYSVIKSGNKIKNVTLTVPNPSGNDTISYPDDILPEEFDLEEYIDKDTIFEKLFGSPIEKIFILRGWNTVKKSNVMSLFGD